MIKIILLVSACTAAAPIHCAAPEQTRPWWHRISDCQAGTAGVVRDLRAEGYPRVMPYACERVAEVGP